MFKRCEKNSIIYPADVKPSAAGYRVVRAYDPGVTLCSDEGNVLVTNGIVIKNGQLFTYYGSSDETTRRPVSSVEQILFRF